MSLGVEPYPSNVQKMCPVSELEEHGKTLTPLPEEIEGEEKEEVLQRLNEEFKDSKHEQIFRFLRDQEELNRRFAQIALEADDEDTASSDGSEGVVTHDMAFYTGRGGRKFNAPARSASFDSLEQNIPSDEERGNLNEFEEEIQRSIAEKKERKRRKQKKQLQLKKDTRPKTAIGHRVGGDVRMPFYDPEFKTVQQSSPPVRYRTDPAPPSAPRSSPNMEYGHRGFPLEPSTPPRGTWDQRAMFDLGDSRVQPTSSRSTAMTVKYSSYGSTSRRPKSVVPATEHTDFHSHTPRRYGRGVSAACNLDESTRQRLYAEAAGIIERQSQNNAAYRQGSRYASENTFITRLDCDESTYRRLSKSAQGVRKSPMGTDLKSIKGNARPIKVLKLPPLEGSVINKNVHGTGLVGTGRGGPGPNVAESLVG